MASHPLEKCTTIKERIRELAKEGRIILDLDEVVKKNHISALTKELSTIQFGSLGPIVLLEHGLSDPITLEGIFPLTFFDNSQFDLMFWGRRRDKQRRWQARELPRRDE